MTASAYALSSAVAAAIMSAARIGKSSVPGRPVALLIEV